MEKSQEDKQTCFPCSPLLLPRSMAPLAPAQPPPASSMGRFNSLNQQYTMQGGGGELKIAIYFQLWKLCCPGRGSVKHDSRHKEGGWAAGEECGSAVRMRCRCRAAEPLPRSGRAQGRRRSLPWALGGPRCAESSPAGRYDPAPRLLCNDSGTRQNAESLPIIHVAFLMCWKAAHGDKLFWQ